jgi:Holliday junction resolvasome RuvABC ATP-dependent DNA helicase subunit
MMSRPAPRFRNFIGQKKIVDYLRRQLAGAQALNEPFPHSLFLGPSGVGKSQLARTLAAELGTTVVEAMGYNHRDDLAQKLSDLVPNDILYIEECHRLGPPEQEYLCEMIERTATAGRQRTQPDRGSDEEGWRAPVAWTLILATDTPGRLLNALNKRLAIQIYLPYYPPGDLKDIVEFQATEMDLLISPQAAGLIAEVAGGLPRPAEMLLQHLRLFHQDAAGRRLGVWEVRQYLDAAGIDADGLDPLARGYLEAVADLGVASLETIALRLGTDAAFVRRQVEAPLVRRGLVRVGPAGRQLSESGRRWEENRRPTDDRMERADRGVES